ncbi:L-threonylcarbamoyladenylate synthase [Candidatus Tisiphia endosymbiont of Nemotelus uliginosus]|uniref:L-threonylcarbamoyladenylate synthase n=1 Tax=Candidatus Tisiphia endosymbiont of Nemotelus uliginosus TaxID=3077926 RepID=UPI0035C8D636
MNRAALDQAADFIKSGNLVAFPTETVYGLGADATNEGACQKIFKIKGRPSINPLIVHVKSLEQAQTIGEFSEDALKLANMFWPGPLSIVVPIKSSAKIARSVLAGLTTIALRCPAHYIALGLITRVGVPIAAPSANPSGYISSTTLPHVQEHFLHEKEVFILIEDRYQSQYGLESTIVYTTATDLAILREGSITREALEKVIDRQITSCGSLMQIKAPGMLLKHYSPKVKLRMNAVSLQDKEIGLNFADSKLNSNFSVNLSINGDLIEAAANLYLKLRLLDHYAIQNKISTIAVAKIPKIGIGAAINDRLKRAAEIT